MTAALILLLSLIVVGAILYIHHRLTSPAGQEFQQEPTTPPADDNECCGMHITCEKDSLVAGIDPTLLYYDDEELDRFKGRGPSSYTTAETEEFREILLTLRPDEIASWARSITTRGITLPDEVREELLMIVAEARKNS